MNLDGPAEALSVVDLPDPEPTHMLSGERAVVVEVHSAGVSFPEVLQTRGEYQLKPPVPFVPGSEVAGVVRSAPDGAAVKAGDRVLLPGWGGNSIKVGEEVCLPISLYIINGADRI